MVKRAIESLLHETSNEINFLHVSACLTDEMPNLQPTSIQMKNLATCAFVSLSLFVLNGCGASKESTNIAEQASVSDLEAYEAEMAAQEAEMNQSMEAASE